MSRPRSGASRSVVPPRTAFSHALKWSIVVIAITGVGVVLLRAHRERTASARAASAETLLPTVENKIKPPEPAPEGMVWIPGGEFSMGAEASGEYLCGLPGV